LFADEPSGSNALAWRNNASLLLCSISASIRVPSDWLPTLTNVFCLPFGAEFKQSTQLLYNNRRQVTHNDYMTSLLKSLNINPSYHSQSQLRCRYSEPSSQRRHPPHSSGRSQLPQRQDHALTPCDPSPPLHVANSPPSVISTRSTHTSHIRFPTLFLPHHEIPAYQTLQ
jgi:hypothetical protein